MERESTPEKFQPRMVASFDKGQLKKVYAWGYKNNVTGKEALDMALDMASRDENGKRMNEISRNRLRYGIAAVTGLVERG